MRKCSMILAMGLLGCNTSPATGPASPETPGANLPGGAALCVGSLAEYCQRTPAGCPTYEESVARQTAHCTQPGAWSVLTHHCVGAYRSVAWRELLLGGGDEYFDGAGQLMAAFLVTDYGAYCNGSSFSQTFGTMPTCPTQLVTQDLCVR